MPSIPPLLLRGGTVITMDGPDGVLPVGDVLVRDGRIEAVGPRLDAPEDARLLDTTGKIVLPGLIDAHRHTWQTALRGVGAEWTLTDYFVYMVGQFGPLFRPEDVYAANLVAATESLNDGATTLADWADGSRTPEHAEAAVQALHDAGVRARFVYADVFASAHVFVPTRHVLALHEQYGSGSGRVTMQVAIDPTLQDGFPEEKAWRFAREHGIPVYSHAGLYGWGNETYLKDLYKRGLMDETNTYVHIVSVGDEERKLIADSGGTVVMASNSNFYQRQGYPRVTELAALGIPVALGSDSDVRYRPDMFTCMRATAGADRAWEHLRYAKPDLSGVLNPTNAYRSRDALRAATVHGARAVGQSGSLDSIAPGKCADLLMLRPDDAGTVPYRFDPVAHVVWQGTPDRVETILVDGEIVKQDGRLTTGPSLERVHELAEATREYLLRQIGEDAFAKAMREPAVQPGAPLQHAFPRFPKPDDPQE
ncbi:amidohydrolase family protein [Streptomyces olivoreticuli]|uniref:amidohydrolase family protein n=1 Tax=Streptomyces olivoreticuli TaxID=68246 RepID=UPI0026587215|nr:amidohydrolase family protein [Streptomyces olivoreticuli]WKK23974.1 amidohydrolase family protein [Streptomyces olivoreticuli]